MAANSKTRAYYAGLVVAKHGHAAGITDEMVTEVDDLYGTPGNVVESTTHLKHVWHALRGYAAVTGIVLPAATGTTDVAPSAT